MKRETMIAVAAWLVLCGYVLAGGYLWANKVMPVDPDRAAVEVVSR